MKFAHIADTHIKNLKYHYEYRAIFEQLYEKLKEEAQLREKETVPWKMRELVYIRDNKNTEIMQCLPKLVLFLYSMSLKYELLIQLN